MNLRARPRAPPASSKPTSPPWPPLDISRPARRRSPVCVRGMDHLRRLPARLPRKSATARRFRQWRSHAQRQRLDALKEQEGVERRHRRAEVAQQRHARLDDVGDRPERLDRLDPDRAVIAGVRRVQRRLALGMRFPVEIAAIDDDAADRGAVAAEIFGRANTRPSPRRDRTAAPGSARRYCP